MFKFKELVFYAILLICNLIIATEWAKYGILEIGIQRPLNKRALKATFIGVTTFLIGGYLQKYGYLKIELLKSPYLWQAAAILIGVPFVWMYFFRHVILPKGLHDYNRAHIKTNYWTILHYRPGVILEEKAKLLREFPMAQKAVKLFYKSIKAQERGTVMRSVDRVIDIDERIIDYYGNIRITCGGCPMPIDVSIYSQGAEGFCAYCGSMIAVRRMGDKLYVTTFITGKKPRVKTELNKRNIASAYSELALLYRMLGKFNEAEQSLDKADEVVKDLLNKNSENAESLGIKSLILFRRAELYHVMGGRHAQAKKLYQESLVIDQKLGHHQEDDLIKELMGKLN